MTPAQLGPIAQNAKATFSSFGGVMFWDASEAYSTLLLQFPRKIEYSDIP